MEINRYRNQLYWCNKCGYCRDTISDELGFYKVCPVYEVKRLEHYSPRGRATIALALVEGLVKPSQSLVDVVYSCLTCGICRSICPSEVDHGIDVPGIVKALRTDLVRMGFKAPDALITIDNNVAESHNVFAESASKRSEWAEGMNFDKQGENLYFAGCYTSFRYPEIGRAAMRILERIGANPSYLGDGELCCGAPQFLDGNINLAKKLAEKNIENITRTGAKRVITTCAGCYHTLKFEYGSLFNRLPFKVEHISEFLVNTANIAKLELKNPVMETVTYHDPCHLGRQEKVYEPPRRLLSMIPQIRLREMKRNRESAWCCGGGAIVGTAFPDLTKQISMWRVSDAKEIEATSIVTSCPLCLTILRRAAAPEKITLSDLTVMLAESAGIQI